MNILKNLFNSPKRTKSFALNNRGILLAQEGRLEEAKQCFEEAIRLFPNNPNPRICISNILVAEGNFSEAEEQIEYALNCNLDSKTKQDAYHNRGRSRLIQNKPWEAINDFQKSIDVFKPDFDIYFNMALSYEKLGEWDNAKEYLEKSNYLLFRPKTTNVIRQLQESSYEHPLFLKLVNNRVSQIDSTENLPNFVKEGEFQNWVNSEIKNKLNTNENLIFFAGSGISKIYPSYLPTANEILNEVFYYLCELDGIDINELWRLKIPFESVFQALKDEHGFKVLRFVELLEGGNPNINHIMLAHAIKKGHLVITTNFDKQIEKAWNHYFPDEPLNILVSDKEFQDSITNNRFKGLLAKIHGDKNDLNSLALTLEGITGTADQTIQVGKDIIPELAEAQSSTIHPKSFLSPSKAFYLQKALNQGKLVTIGYSGSDKHDIMPILLSPSFDIGGIWVNHDSKLNRRAAEWVLINKKERDKRKNSRCILKPKNTEEQNMDITLRTSQYFLQQWIEAKEYSFFKENEHLLSTFNVSFKEWVRRLRLRPGDGFAFVARLYSQMGLWEKSEQFSHKASLQYEREPLNTEGRLLNANFNRAAMLRNKAIENSKENVESMLSSPDRLASFSIYKSLKSFIEENSKEEIYLGLYGQILLSLAIFELEDDNISIGQGLIVRVLSLAKNSDNHRLYNMALQAIGTVYLQKKQYKEALDYYMDALKMASNVHGDYFVAFDLNIKVALCFAYLGQQYPAMEFTAEAKSMAAISGNENFKYEAEDLEAFILQRFFGNLNDSKNIVRKNHHQELFDKAYAGFSSRDKIIFDRDISTFMQHNKYELCLLEIDKLIKNYELKNDVIFFLRWYKSNIYMRMGYIEPNLTKRSDYYQKEKEILIDLDKKRPNFPLVLHNLGLVYQKLGFLKKAEEQLLKAIKASNEYYPLACGNLSLVYLGLHDLEKAKKYHKIAKEQGAPVRVLEMIEQRLF